MQTMPVYAAFGWVFLGIIVSLVLPIAVDTLRKAKLENLQAPKPTFAQRVSQAWTRYGGNKYVGIAAAAALVAGVLLFFTGQSFYRVRDAVLAGFAWESFVNKIYSSQPPTN